MTPRDRALMVIEAKWSDDQELAVVVEVAIMKAIADEREACAKLCEKHDTADAYCLADHIRARGNP